jgi:hypothetical protein
MVMADTKMKQKSPQAIIVASSGVARFVFCRTFNGLSLMIYRQYPHLEAGLCKA